MVYNFTSTRVVIAKTFRDLSIDGQQWVNDAIEWLAEALEFIGAFNQQVQRNVMLEVVSHTASLPIDLIQVLGVYTAPLAEDSGLTTFQSSQKHPILPSGSIAHPGTHSAFGDVAPGMNVSFTDEQDYQINGGYIHTHMESGNIGITYLAMPVDDEGWPLIPDKVQYKEALRWYITHKLILSRRWLHPEISLDYAFQMWNRYCGQARNNANMPDLAQAENFRRRWVRNILPDNAFVNSFDNDEVIRGYRDYGSDNLATNAITP